MNSTNSQPKKIGFFNAQKIARELEAENTSLHLTKKALEDELRQKSRVIQNYGVEDVELREKRKAELASRVDHFDQEIRQQQIKLADLRAEEKEAASRIVDLRGTYELQSDGLYDFAHPAEHSTELAAKLASVRAQIKDAVRAKRATAAASGFTFNNSESKGRRFIEDMSKMMLRAYNAEAENCVGVVRAGNLSVAMDRLSKVRDQIRKLGNLISLDIQENYHRLRLEEIGLAAQHLEAIKVEKEKDREEKERLREERKAQQELERAREKLEKELGHYRSVLTALQARGDMEGVARIQASIESAESELKQVDFRAANIRAGYVYVISNVGSLGPDVVKIGMTRRLEPMDRVNELGDASVPFRFDVHALFFSVDAVGIEAMLHQHFSDTRINRVNLRKEFFRAAPSQVLEVLKKHQVEIVEFTPEAIAEEYRLSTATAEAAPPPLSR
jgi:hypothetical protein